MDPNDGRRKRGNLLGAGMALDNIALGVAIGIGTGVAIGAGLGALKK